VIDIKVFKVLSQS